jgi:hypothetical protein
MMNGEDSDSEPALGGEHVKSRTQKRIKIANSQFMMMCSNLSPIHDDIYIACPQFVMRLNCEITLIVLKLESLSLF